MKNEITIHDPEVQKLIGGKTIVAHNYNESHRSLVVIAHHEKDGVEKHDIIRAEWKGDKIEVSCELQDGSEGQAFEYFMKHRSK